MISFHISHPIISYHLILYHLIYHMSSHIIYHTLSVHIISYIIYHIISYLTSYHHHSSWRSSASSVDVVTMGDMGITDTANLPGVCWVSGLWQPCRPWGDGFVLTQWKSKTVCWHSGNADVTAEIKLLALTGLCERVYLSIHVSSLRPACKAVMIVLTLIYVK